MKKLIVVVWALVFSGIMLASAEMRIWTSIKGDTIEAEFVNIFSGKVVLRKSDGKEIKVPQSGLCAEDIKFLNESIPPKIDIEVDVDNDRKNLQSYSSDYGTYDYSKKAQKIKCEVTITKKSRQANMTPLKACIYVFSEDSREDELRVISMAEHEFSFEHQNSATFSTDRASLTITKSSSDYGYGHNSGAEYCGYVVYVEDSKGKTISVRSSSKRFEKNLHKMKNAVKGTRLDDDFNMINPPKKKKKKRN